MTTTIAKDLNLRPDITSKIQASNFLHLYWDVAWYGIAFGSTLSFLPVFVARLGAAGWQIGFLTAGPALISILFTLPIMIGPLLAAWLGIREALILVALLRVISGLALARWG